MSTQAEIGSVPACVPTGTPVEEQTSTQIGMGIMLHSIFHLEGSILLSYERMRATNICAWLKVNSLAICGKSCVYEYCGTHRQQLRLGLKSPVPCRYCGVGTGSATLLCRPCGAQRIAQKLIDTEKRARRDFTVVLVELKIPI